MITPARNWTFAELDEECRAVTRSLVALGVERGQRIAVWSGNIPQWILLQFALARLGAILVTVNTALRAEELGYLLRQSGATFFFTVASLRGLDTRAELEKAGPLPDLRETLLLDEWAAFLERGEGLADPVCEVGLDDCVNMQYTSGTTGFPKGVRLSSRNILNNGYWLGQGLGYTPDDRLCLSVPLFHCFGCVIGVLAAYTHGVCLCLVEYFEPRRVLEAVQRHACTSLYGVPTMFLGMLEHPEFAHFDLSSLRKGVMAGSLCPETVMRRVMGEMHMREVVIVYGLTEASPGITMTPRHDPVELRCSTVGKVMPEQEVQLAPDGELWVRGYNVMEGYHDNLESTRAALDDDGWLRTGDQATIDEHGYVRIVGRLKDTIIRGGENIAPAQVEDALRLHPAVLDAAVYGLPCSYYGEQVAAAIRLRAHVHEDDLRDHCAQHVARFKVPKVIRFVDEFPLTASGKVQKYRLREMHEEFHL